VALSRDLASNNLWVESLERSLARRGRPRRASLELGKLTPPRDLSDPDNLAESVLYWRTRRAAASTSPIPAAGGATALALLAATTLPSLTAGHTDGAKTLVRHGGRAGTGAGTRTELVHKLATARQAFDPSKVSGLGQAATAAAATPFAGKVLYGSIDSVQRMLGVKIDGEVGPATGAAIRAFQTAHGLVANGIVDQTTYDAMQAANPTAATVNETTPITVTGGGVIAHDASAAASVAVTAPVQAPAAGATTAPTSTAPTSTAPTTDGGATGATTAATPTSIASDGTTAAADTTAATEPAVPAGVTAVQAALHVEVDGTFGTQTKDAVEAFQSAHGLAADGVVGPQTRAALGIGAGPTLQDTQPPPPPPAPVDTAIGANTPAAGDGGTAQTETSSGSSTSDSASTTTTTTSTGTPTASSGEPGNVATGMAEMIAAANQIATLPYIWGGGHGSWVSPGYDCSGSVSYVLHAAGLLSAPEDSSELESYGAPGPGQYITIYATAGHAWMTIDGKRFDTVALSEDGSRWASGGGEFAGFVERHPIGY
jgi:peptidoglycan hydrolase-like protein with peptidoglycan-binding domain